MSFSSTMLVADVAFLFVSGGMVPHVAYLTMLDYYVYGSFVFMCGVVIQVCLVRVIEDRDGFDEEEAGKVRRWMGLCNISLLLIINLLWTYISYLAYNRETGRFESVIGSEHER